MLQPRTMPCLLLGEQGALVKTVRFRKPRYLGDPITAVKIFNDRQAPELVLLDIAATPGGRGPDIERISDIVSEAFMPLLYGGGVTTIEQIRAVLRAGVEKVALNSAAVTNPALVSRAADEFGSQSVVVALDVKRGLLSGHQLVTHNGRRKTRLDPVETAREMVEAGAGELIVNSVDRDGTMIGYDIELVRRIAHAVPVPVVACGGAGKLQDLVDVVQKGGASAAAAGSLFVYHGPHRAVLINYPSESALEKAFGE